ncbi:DUF3987 domain-containing protein [Paraburkholderia sp. A3BS-1L]|uniref:DUF3987 domain-containing protein n=1 Tax=Paraburkholderia sp. A3BS-1L TaxID=3028375 RepID=UPI003DA8C58F
MYGAGNQNLGNTAQPEYQLSEYRLQQNGRGRTYPIDAFPPIIRQAIIDVDAELGGGIELAASAALGIVSTACQEFVNVQRPKLKPSSCSLFLITIAGTGAGKSEIQNNFITELEAFEREEESRANEASEGSRKLSRKVRIEMLAELREREYEALVEYDELREKEGKVRKHLDYQNEVLSGRRPVIEVRGKRPEPLEARVAAANHALESLLLRIQELQSELAEIQAEIRDTIGPAARRLVYGRGSFAGFRNGLQDKCRSAGIISAEAGGILNSALVTRNMDAWNDLWGCEFYRETYDKREYVIESPRLTLALMLQPKQFQKFLDNCGENALDNGFLSRTLLLKVPSYPPKSAGGSDDAPREIGSLKKFHQRIQAILGQQFPCIPERTVLTFSATARRYWESYYNKLSVAIAEKGKFDTEMEGFVRKLPEQAARIAALFHYFEMHPVRNSADSGSATDAYGRPALKGKERDIPIETVQAAIRLCDWYMAEFRMLVVASELPEPLSAFAFSTQVRANADKILRTIEKNYWKYVEAQHGSACVKLEYKKIQNANRTIKTQGEILAALHCLASEGRLYLGRGKKGGYFVCYNRSGFYGCGRCVPTPTLVKQAESPSAHEVTGQSVKLGLESDARQVGVVDQGPQSTDIPVDYDAYMRGKSLLDIVKAKRPNLVASEEETKETSAEEQQFPLSVLNSGEDQSQSSRFILPHDQLNRAVSSSLGFPADDDEEVDDDPNAQD